MPGKGSDKSLEPVIGDNEEKSPLSPAFLGDAIIETVV
jgi:hypothetical protein